MAIIFVFGVNHPSPADRVTLVMTAIFAIEPDLNGFSTLSGYLLETLQCEVIKIPAALLAHVTTLPGECLK